MTVGKNEIDGTRDFTFEDTQFNFAIGFPAKSWSGAYQDISEYLEIEAYALYWNFNNESGHVDIGSQDIAMRPCVESDLDNFYDFGASTILLSKSQWSSQYCVDHL